MEESGSTQLEMSRLSTINELQASKIRGGTWCEPVSSDGCPEYSSVSDDCSDVSSTGSSHDSDFVSTNVVRNEEDLDFATGVWEGVWVSKCADEIWFPCKA